MNENTLQIQPFVFSETKTGYFLNKRLYDYELLKVGTLVLELVILSFYYALEVKAEYLRVGESVDFSERTRQLQGAATCEN